MKNYPKFPATRNHKWTKKYAQFVENFSSQTTVHGLNFLGKPKLHLVERLFWLIIVFASFAGVVSLTLSNWNRYSENPTVVSLQKDFRQWFNPFPAATGCFLNKVDSEKAKQFIYTHWHLTPENTSYDYYMEFVKIVGNVSYTNLKFFEKFKNDPSFNKIDLLELAVEVHPKLSGTLVTFDAKRKTKWKLIMSELGLCFSMNSKFAAVLSAEKDNNKEKDDDDQSILRCHYLNGLCYARYDSDPTLHIQYYIHSHLDVIHATADDPLLVKDSEELEINYRMQETIASESLRDLTPNQRKCRFDNEPSSNDLPVFSTTMCYIGCRYRLALKLCGCRPFFYHFLKGKICDIKGLICLSKYVNNITLPPAEIGCQCPQPCDIITYLPQVPKMTKWEFGYFDQRITFRWGLLAPTTKYKRDILFTFDDLVASVGGTLSLFLGMSFIGLLEIVFLTVENSYKVWKSEKRNQTLKRMRKF